MVGRLKDRIKGNVKLVFQPAGEARVAVPDLTMGGEDMSFFLKRVPGCYYCIGVGREGAAPLHHPRFDFNEDVMGLGIETHCRVALDLLGPEESISITHED